jgi:phosphoglycolate phosphatase
LPTAATNTDCRCRTVCTDVTKPYATMTSNTTDADLRAVAFDLDGTLVDSAPDIGHALNQALGESGLPRVELPQVRAWIGDGPDALIARALEALGQGDDAPLRGVLRQAFDRATLSAPLLHGAVFEGVPALLQSLRPGWPLVVVTNKPSRLARAVLDAGGLLQHFAAVFGADTPALRKPAPAMLRLAAQALDLPAPQLLMVGDSSADMASAAAAGSPAAWAGWGYGALHSLPTPPRWQVHRPGDLLAILGAQA